MAEVINYHHCNCGMAIPRQTDKGWVMGCQVRQLEDQLGHRPTAKEILELKRSDGGFIIRLTSIPVDKCPNEYKPLRF